MILTTRPSLRNALNDKCRDCIFDPGAVGRWREQTAAGESVNWALHEIRPVPRSCTAGGAIDPAKIAALRIDLEARMRTRSVALRGER